MKKVIIFLIVIIGIFAAIAVVTKMQQSEKAEGNPYKKESLDPATIDQLDDPLYQNLILPDELKSKLEDEEDVTVYFYSPTCPHCRDTTPVVSPLTEDLGIDLVQFNLLEFKQGWDNYRIEATPTVIHFENGKEAARITGSQPKETWENWFTENVKE
ncbi:thiol-disulfide isomerase/thioredoxin [Bacillus pakistanensis]|uniref:Thiol-disulfide isomerase/thioredoxin n=1 Tax=Rossellomorea pakistanensis TaxID=992288 RepID=A0ABS2NEU6_9BACI|nr:thioredoxin family protein [Bacillus pakistanensis]MBM7586343.1 thiol-disulfide isomerase/thioredoxin [Bacillus pakistanensis]